MRVPLKSRGTRFSSQEFWSQVLDRLAGDRAQYVTTMIDLYGPLAAGGFPGFTTDPPPPKEPYARVAWLERAFLDDARRFIPYLQLYEFEALVLARPRRAERAQQDRRRSYRAVSRSGSPVRRPPASLRLRARQVRPRPRAPPAPGLRRRAMAPRTVRSDGVSSGA